ncbi:hypothetical protein V5799_020735, partial [Amblyomma americanum]
MTASHASSRTRAHSNPALEALSMATRRALEESADLTFDICRMNGDFEASSDVVGYFPDLNIAGTHSHPSELLARYRGSPEKSGGYTIVESSNAGSTGDPKDQSVSDVCSSKAGDAASENDSGTNEKLTAGHQKDCSSESRSSVSEVPEATVVPTTEDTSTTRSSQSAVESSNRMQEETVTAGSSDTSVSSSHRAGQSGEPAEDVPHEGAEGGATGGTAPRNGHGDAIVSASPFTTSRHAYVQTSVATPPRCRSVPPLHFTPVLCRPTKTAEASRPAGSGGSATTASEEDACLAGPLVSREDGHGDAERKDDAHLIAKPNAGGEVRESANNGSVVSGGVTSENSPYECWRDTGACSDSAMNPVRTSDEAAGTDSASPMLSSAGGDAVALQNGACEHAPQEQPLACHPAAGNVSPERVPHTRERWAVRLQGDLQMAEPDLYSGLDSPKSSFSFSSGYLSEEALSPTMRYHSSASPLPQLSPSRLSPLLPTLCQPPVQQVTAAAASTREAAEPPKERREAVLPEAKEPAPGSGVPTRQGSVMPCGRQRREPSPPSGAPTPLQKMSALVSELPPPAASHGACFQSPFAPPPTAVDAACGSQRRDAPAFK